MSIIKHSEQRVGVFIDAQNLYHSANNLYGRNVNFGNVLTESVAGRIIVRALAYVITSETKQESPFFDALTKSGIETKTKDLQVFSSGAKKADWDVGIAVDAIKMASKLDTVILISGDGDFIPLVEYLKNVGCQVELVSFGRSTSGKLLEVVDDVINLDDELDFYLMKGGKDKRFSNRKHTSRPFTPRTQSTSGVSNKEPKSTSKKEAVPELLPKLDKITKATPAKTPPKAVRKTPVKKATSKAPTKKPASKTTRKAPRKAPTKKATPKTPAKK